MNDDEDELQCHHYIERGVTCGQRCPNKISMRLDPEKKFCRAHLRCVYPKEREEKVVVGEPKEKYTDFITFKVSVIKYYN